jgi:galactonate dehydratase
MRQTNRRTLLKRGMLSIAGMAGLPSLRAAVEQTASEYRRPKLKITDVRTAEVRVHGYQVHVRIYTDQGIVGQGESTDAATGNVPIIRGFGRMLIGQDPLNIEAAFERIRTSGVFAGAQAGQYVTAQPASRSPFGILRAKRSAFPFTSCSAARCGSACASTAIPARAK